MKLDLRTSRRDAWSMVELAGEVDISTAPDLDRVVREVAEAGSVRIVVETFAG